MPALGLLKTILGKAGDKAFAVAVINEYFPDTFKSELKASFSDLNRKIDGIAQDAAYLRIQPVKDEFIEQFDYFENTLLPFLAQHARTAMLDNNAVHEQAAKAAKHSEKLRATFEKGKSVLNERMATCDYPLRTLFEILKNIASLRLTTMSWTYFLKSQSGATGDSLALLDDDYARFRTEAKTFISDAIERICDARLAKMRLEKDIRYRNIDGELIYVRVLYRDEFSSGFQGDPFAGSEINQSNEAELRWFDHSFLYDAKKLKLANAFGDAENWTKDYADHRQKVIALNTATIADPTRKFVEALGKTPARLV